MTGVQTCALPIYAPLAFCENILGLLRTAGIVQSRRGAEGGYLLAKAPDHVTVADVIRAIEDEDKKL